MIRLVSLFVALVLWLNLPGTAFYCALGQHYIAPAGLPQTVNPQITVPVSTPWSNPSYPASPFIQFSSISGLDGVLLGEFSADVSLPGGSRGFFRPLAAPGAPVALIRAPEALIRPLAAPVAAPGAHRASGAPRVPARRAGAPESLIRRLVDFKRSLRPIGKGAPLESPEALKGNTERAFLRLLSGSKGLFESDGAVGAVGLGVNRRASDKKAKPELNAREVASRGEVPFQEPLQPLVSGKFRAPFSVSARLHGFYWASIGMALAGISAAALSADGFIHGAIWVAAPVLVALTAYNFIKIFSKMTRYQKDIEGWLKEQGAEVGVEGEILEEDVPFINQAHQVFLAVLQRLGAGLSQAPRFVIQAFVTKDGGDIEVVDGEVVNGDNGENWNARSFGYGLSHSSIITLGFNMVALNPYVLAGVISHEIAHLRFKDLLRKDIWEGLCASLGMVVRHAIFPPEKLAGLFSKAGFPGRVLKYGFSPLALVWAGKIVLSSLSLQFLPWSALILASAMPVFLAFSGILGLAYLRAQELRADAFSGWFTHPDYMKAFVKLTPQSKPNGYSEWIYYLTENHPHASARLKTLDRYQKETE